MRFQLVRAAYSRFLSGIGDNKRFYLPASFFIVIFFLKKMKIGWNGLPVIEFSQELVR